MGGVVFGGPGVPYQFGIEFNGSFYNDEDSYNAAVSLDGGGGGGGGGGPLSPWLYGTTTSDTTDTVYATGYGSAIGDRDDLEVYDLQGGNDTVGDSNLSTPGLAGNDFIDGGDGNDIMYMGGGSDWALAGDGNDIIYGDSNIAGSADMLVGDAGSDWIIGGGGDSNGGDFLVGGSIDPSSLSPAQLPDVQPEFGVADYFLFRQDDGFTAAFSPADPYNLIMDFQDGVDMIGFYNSDTSAWTDTPFSSGLLTTAYNDVFEMTFVTDVAENETLFRAMGDVTFDDTDVVGAAAISGMGIA
jgi:hypothetical protein